MQRLAELKLDARVLVSRTYDEEGRLAALNNGRAIMNIDYLGGSSQIQKRTWSVGENDPFLILEHDYDGYTRLTGISANNNPFINYILNDDDLRLSTRLMDGSTWEYSYDQLNQLTSAIRKDNSDNELNTMFYDYDMIGNRLASAEDDSSREYSTNLLNQYTQVIPQFHNSPIQQFSYDANGNMLTNHGWEYTWNHENRLSQAQKDHIRLEFDYDYKGRRVFKKVFDSGNIIRHEKYVYDDFKLIAVYDGLDNDALLMTFVWQPDSIGLDVPLCMSYNGDFYYYLTDGNKNVTAIIDENGILQASYTYGPFGQILTQAGPLAEINPFRFSSEFHDDETKMVYYNYRYYDTSIGRWTKRDMIGENGGTNLYEMVYNNIINRFDNLGFFANVKYCERAIWDFGKLSSLSPDHAYILVDEPIFPDLRRPDPDDPALTEKQRETARKTSPPINQHTIGWAGKIYNEDGVDWNNSPVSRECWNTIKLNKGYLPDKKTSCKCATEKQIKACLYDNRYFAATKTYKTLSYNCKSWAKELLKICCLKKK